MNTTNAHAAETAEQIVDDRELWEKFGNRFDWVFLSCDRVSAVFLIANRRHTISAALKDSIRFGILQSEMTAINYFRDNCLDRIGKAL